MVVNDARNPKQRWLDALFGGARERQRRRHHRQLFLALLACLGAAALAAGMHAGRPSGASTVVGSRLSVKVTSATLALHGSYHELEAAGGRLVVTGGDVDSMVGTCSSTTVDPVTLRAISTARGNCANPALYGQTVLPIRYISSHSGPSGLTLGLRIATLTQGSRAGYRLGPVVFTYPQCSDCGIVWIYGHDSLWVYSPFATSTAANVGELFRISERTGRVAQRWTMPSFTRALLAVDNDGLWVSQSLYGGMPMRVPRAQRADYRSLYRIAPGMRSPARAKQLNSWGAYWIVASGNSVWVDESDGGRPSRLWRLEGIDAAPVITARPLPSGADCAEMGEGQASTAGDLQTGVNCIALSQTGGELRSFDPETGAASAAPLPTLRPGAVSRYFSGPGPAVAVGRSVFFLEEDRLLKATTR